MTTILEVLGTSTPVSEVLAEKLGYVKAAIACRVFFYQQLDDGVCRASTKTLATKLGMSQGAISNNLKWLVDNDYIRELGEHRRGNVSNQYVVTDKFYAALKQPTSEEIERSLDERLTGQRSADERNVHQMNVNVQQMNGKEESKEDLKERLTHTQHDRPKIIPAYKVFVDAIGENGVSKQWIARMDKIVGDDPQDLDFWKQVIIAWDGCGWSGRNVKGMLEYYRRRELPGKKPKQSQGVKNGRSKGTRTHQPSSRELSDLSSWTNAGDGGGDSHERAVDGFRD